MINGLVNYKNKINIKRLSKIHLLILIKVYDEHINKIMKIINDPLLKISRI